MISYSGVQINLNEVVCGQRQIQIDNCSKIYPSKTHPTYTQMLQKLVYSQPRFFTTQSL